MKAKRLVKMLQKLDPETDLFVGAELPGKYRELLKYVSLNLTKPQLDSEYEDIDGSKSVFLTFQLDLDVG